MTDLTLSLSTGQQVLLKPAPVKKFKGTRLPGAELLQADQAGIVVSIHDVRLPLFAFSLRAITCETEQLITIKEASRYLRLETVLTGALVVKETNGTQLVIRSGQYRLTNAPAFQLQYNAGAASHYFICFISPALLSQTPMAELVASSAVMTMPFPMTEVVQRILDNPFEDKFRNAFYDHSIRELLFYHISAPTYTLPGEMSAREIAAVHEADKIIASDLSMHLSIHELAKQTRTNTDVLKKGFARIFGMGPFERLLQRKMDRAKNLLEATDKQVQDIAELSGYETVTGFINAFRKNFKMTPKDWRKKSKGLQ
jgi:AraC-like DNA-binding protein